MENIIRTAVEVCDQDHDYDLTGIRGYESRLRKPLLWRNRKARFFAFTERSKEFLWMGFSICFGALAMSYFIAQWLLYITK